MKYILLLSIFILTGCSNMLFSGTPDDGNQRVLVFQDLLKQGWEIQIVDGKTFLVKHTEEGLLVQDVFGLDNQEDSLW